MILEGETPDLFHGGMDTFEFCLGVRESGGGVRYFTCSTSLAGWDGLNNSNFRLPGHYGLLR